MIVNVLTYFCQTPPPKEKKDRDLIVLNLLSSWVVFVSKGNAHSFQEFFLFNETLFINYFIKPTGTVVLTISVP